MTPSLFNKAIKKAWPSFGGKISSLTIRLPMYWRQVTDCISLKTIDCTHVQHGALELTSRACKLFRCQHLCELTIHNLTLLLVCFPCIVVLFIGEMLRHRWR